MHWIERYRRETIGPEKRGNDRQEYYSMRMLAAQVRALGAGCSAALIEILEAGGTTRPGIAGKIAEACGATAAQYDEIVLEKHRGGWTPPVKKGRRADYPSAACGDSSPDNGSQERRGGGGIAFKERKLCNFARQVVQLAEDGSEIARFRSENKAAEAAFCEARAVRDRCKRRMSKKKSEIAAFGCTWRYADEWDAMSETAREADMEHARTIRKRGNGDGKRNDA